MKAAVYITEIPEKYERKNMEHLTGEKLLETALFKEYGKTLAFEPRAKGRTRQTLLYFASPKSITISVIPGNMWYA